MRFNSKHGNSPRPDSGVALHADPRVESETATSRASVGDGSVHAPKLVYLLSRYPAVSHTFFLNEVLQLRGLGFSIDVASINGPDRAHADMPEIEAAEANETFYIKEAGVAKAVGVAVKTVLLRPQVFIRGLVAALRLGGWKPASTLLALFYFAECLILGDWMRSRGHRHMHIHFGGPVATVGMLTSMAWGFEYSLTIHGPDEFYNVEKFHLRQKVEHAKFILCISNFCRSQLMLLVAPQFWDKMHVVRLGVDTRVFSPLAERRAPEHTSEILCVGRLVSSKGQFILLRACEQLVSQGYSFRLHLAGAGPDRELLESFAAEKNLPVVFEGAKKHDEVRQLLARTDIFVLASFAEGVPVALMEAMAMEIPCVSTRIAGIPELIRDGLDGILVPASSPDELASALRRLIEDRPLRYSLGTAGAKRVQELYNLCQNAGVLAETLNRYLLRID